jgi:DNA-binding transcriptional regulator YiaG
MTSQYTPREIRHLRRSLGLNASDFGTLVGVSGRTIEDWEQGTGGFNRRPVNLLGLRAIPPPVG